MSSNHIGEKSYDICAMSGEQKFKRRQFSRQFVQRVLMGPPDMIQKELLDDDLQQNHDLSVWGFLLLKANPINIDEFQRGILEESNAKPFIGRMQPGEGLNFAASSSWTDPKVMDFGSEEVQAKVEEIGRCGGILNVLCLVFLYHIGFYGLVVLFGCYSWVNNPNLKSQDKTSPLSSQK